MIHIYLRTHIRTHQYAFDFQKQNRICNNPEPNFYGKPCIGSAEIEGYCNSSECDDIPVEIIDFVNSQFKLKHYSFEVSMYQNISISLPSIITDCLKKFPLIFVTKWIFNGIVLKHANFTSTLTLKNVTVSNNGIYVCLISLLSGKKYPIMIASVAVKNQNYDYNLKVNSKLVMKCRGFYVNYIYSQLSQKWFLNDRLYESHESIVGDKTILSINRSHIGVWKCLIEKNDKKFSWLINVCNVNVFSPTILTFVVEDQFTAPIFKFDSNLSVVLSIVIIIISLFISIILFYFYLRCTLSS